MNWNISSDYLNNKINFMTDILKINRSKWRTGSNGFDKTGQGSAALLNREGYMCCLGFRCHQLGIPKKDLLGCEFPESTGWQVIPDLLTTKGSNTVFTEEAAEINDNTEMSRTQREQRIKEHFAKKKIKVVFTGKYSN
jgi:hypothetical protein